MSESYVFQDEVVYFEYASDRATFLAFDPTISIGQNRMLALAIKNEGLRRLKQGISDLGRIYCALRTVGMRQCA